MKPLRTISFCTVLLLMLQFCPFSVHARVMQSEQPAEGITLRTEMETYPCDVKRILVIWENKTDKLFFYGESFSLQKKTNGQWETVKMAETTKEGYDIAFNAVAHSLPPLESRKHIYTGLDQFFPKGLTPGDYRIFTTVDWDKSETEYIQHPIYAEFKVEKEPGNLEQSELYRKGLEQYRDITGYDLLQATSAHLYRHPETHRSILVLDGKRYLLSGTGGYGVASHCYYRSGDKEYLLYVYSYTNDKDDIRTRVHVLNLKTHTVVYKSEDFAVDRLGITWDTEKERWEIFSYIVEVDGPEYLDEDTPPMFLYYKNGRFSMST